MNNAAKAIVLILVLLYIISPLDLSPGPIDDIIVLLMGLGSQKLFSNKE
ncbi:MAG: hypothetical protein PUH30_00405 [Oscillospiraceae bacterium]|nr:hypothetical protein [Oscillospiraceae bacterium]